MAEKAYKSAMIRTILLAFTVFTSIHVHAQDLFGLENSSEHEVAYLSTDSIEEEDASRARKSGLLNPRSTLHARIFFTGTDQADWRLDVFQNAQNPDGPTFFIPHDSENEAFQAGAWAISVFGGHLIALECGESRTCDKGIDPNRHFLQGKEVYTSSILRFFENKSYPVFTLHNNHDSHYRLGGRGAIYADLPAPYTDGTGIFHSGDPDDLIIYSDTRPAASSDTFRFYNEEFKRGKLNSIFELITESNALGGHMSTHVIRNTPMEYFNVEAQHGHLSEQRRYIKELMKILGVSVP